MFPGWVTMLGNESLYQMQNSLLFRGGQKIYRSFTSSATWGFSAWVRRSKLGAINPILGSAIKFNANDTLTAGSLTTTAVYRDPTAWMHVSIAAGHLYVNGVDKGAVTTSAFTCSSSNCLGFDGTNYFHGYIAEPAFIDGSQPTSAPGLTDMTTGSWAPRPTPATWGTNGVYLGKPWNTASLGTDYSGRGNHWTPVGFAASDVVGDSPTNVYATLNSLDRVSATLSDGCLHVVTGGNGNTSPGGYACGGVSVSSGKWYFEVTGTSIDLSGGNGFAVGFRSASAVIGSSAWALKTPSVLVYITFLSAGKINDGGTFVDYGATFTDGDVVGIALDLDAGTLTFTKNGVSQGVAYSGLSGTFRPIVCDYGLSCAADVNFGQRPFAFTPPSGFQSLCTANLPATTGVTIGNFTGNANTDGPCVYTGAVPETLTINSNSVTWGTHADKLATGFKLRTSSSSYNSTGTNSWIATYSTPQKPTVGSNQVPANAQGNP